MKKQIVLSPSMNNKLVYIAFAGTFALMAAMLCSAVPKPDNPAKEAKKLEKQGWKAMGGTIEEQLAASFRMQQTYNDDGSPRYVVERAISKGRSLSEAKAASENTVRMMLSSSISSSIQAEAVSATINAGADSSLTNTIQRAGSSSVTSFDSSSCKVVVSMYKKEQNGYQVWTVMAYDTNR